MASRDQATPDFFASGSDADTQSKRLTPGEKPSATLPYLLPVDLPKALSWLSNVELEALGIAVGEERSRRALTDAGAATVAEESGEPNSARSPKAAEPRAVKAAVERPRMTSTRVKAIRAGFKAGVKPSMLARQFGVTLAAIRESLTETSD